MIQLPALCLGAALDALIGDPHGFPHIVIGIGRLIGLLERLMRRIFPDTKIGARIGGGLLTVLVCAAAFGIPYGLLYLCGRVHLLLRFAVEALLCWQCLALRSLRDESMLVYAPLKNGDIQSARAMVGRIVGRDTGRLDAAGVNRAAVETVAENASDGVIAPLLFLAVGGAPLGVLYKAVNTMDSMLGYKNERYLYFGRAAAHLDDIANFLPARITALLLILSAFLLRLDGKNAWRIFKRDRYNHKSPNSAQPESACAGALGLRLGGSAYYGGVLVEKPAIGDDSRAIEPEDILRANALVAVSFAICFTLIIIIKGALLWL